MNTVNYFSLLKVYCTITYTPEKITWHLITSETEDEEEPMEEVSASPVSEMKNQKVDTKLGIENYLPAFLLVGFVCFFLFFAWNEADS